MTNNSSIYYDVSTFFPSLLNHTETPGDNGTPPSSVWEIYKQHCPEATMIDKYLTPYVYVVGFPGNILALVIWLQKRMRNSSGYYLAALALADLVFLLLQIVYELNEKWGIRCLDVEFVCEFYPIIFLTSQYLSPLLVLAFTVERYISICHPFSREKFCTTKRAKIVIACLFSFSFLINGIQGYFWHYDSGGRCSLRAEVVRNHESSFWSIWTWCVEALVFFLVPILILVFNILVIAEAKRLSKFEKNQLQSRTTKNSATTVMLLAVSFYQIFTTLPVTIVVTLYYSFPIGDPANLNPPDSIWQRHFDYVYIKTIIEEIGLTHYACNFYIYCVTGKVFRQEFKRLWRSLVCLKMKSALPNWTTEYTSLRGSLRNNPKNLTVRMSNGHANGHSTTSSTNGVQPMLSEPTETTL
ncbi:C-C chemokine receptor type 1-like [Ylistrum balloti]|uniref:C-C chemokine receptor type 1-like n=1 Tax=Ylistrum balloti TaxID=509963 RepID=UPI002905A25E|nr:C-C chemokine receptor type 1-like [Ylistrum balloti]